MKSIMLITGFLLIAQSSTWNVNSKGIAIEGYDPVSYFKGTPKEGQKTISYTYHTATFLFSSKENKQQFQDSPEAYLPEYGGFCAYAMGASGDKVEVDPHTFKMLNGKLYLFYNAWGNNTLKPWNQNEQTLKQQADKNWNKIAGSDQ